MMTWLIWLDKVSEEDVSRVGGKAAPLGAMLAAGFPVPRGFCVTVDAYGEQIARTPIGGEIDRLLSERADGEASLSAEIGALFREAEVLPEIDAAIREALGSLGPAVAVRSSGTAEDLATASFAGQHETALGVRGADAVLEALRACWASLWSERAIAYRQRQGIDHRSVAISVLVQEMVSADTAGVLFTVDPVNGRDDRMVLTASFGLGEAVVGGLVSPDSFVLSKEPLRIVERRIARKERAIVPAGQGVETQALPPERADAPSLEDAHVLAIAEMGLSVERRRNGAQDIEWALSDGKVYLLQARPVTRRQENAAPLTASAAPALPDTPLPSPEEGVYGWVDLGRVPWLVRARLSPLLLKGWILDHFPEPLRPLDIHVTLGAVWRGIRRMATDLGVALPGEVARPHPSGLVLYRVPLPSLFSLLVGLPRALFRVRALHRHVPLREWQEVDGPHLRPQVQAALDRAREPIPLAEIPGEIRKAMDIAAENIYRRFTKYLPAGNAVAQKLTKLLAKLAPGEAQELERKLLHGLDHKTARINADLKALARAGEGEPAARRVLLERPFGERYRVLRTDPGCAGFAAALDDFLHRHGCRTAIGMEPAPSYPAWRDAPEELLSTVAAMLGSPAALADDAEQKEREYAEARVQLRSQIRRPDEAAAFDEMIDRHRGFLVAREDTLYLFEECVAAIRAMVARAAALLVAEDKLGHAREIFYLSPDEVERLCQAPKQSPGAQALKELAAVRRAVWNRARGALRVVGQPRTEAVDQHFGTGTSPGIATGPARIILSPQDFGKLRQGDVMICPSTNPAWTPLFLVTSAVVTDVGGALSHAAIVAREYGIPAVMGCGNVTSVLRDGELLEVDGAKGRVRRLSTKRS